jgi:hypothetical protein
VLGGHQVGWLVVFQRDTARYLGPLKVPREQEFIESNNQALADWWNHYVETDTPPPMQPDDLTIRYPSANEGSQAEASSHIKGRHR